MIATITRAELDHMGEVDVLAQIVWMRRIEQGTARIIEEGGESCQASS